MDLNDGKRAFAGLKSKLGFGGRTKEEDYEEYYDDYEEYDESDDYGEMGFDEDSYAPSSRYDRYNSVTTREAGSRSTMPRLVSIEDVRARTQVPTLPDRDTDRGGYSSRRSSAGGSSFRTMVDSSLPPTMTPEGTAAVSAAASASRAVRSDGLNSLFEPTAAPEPAASAPVRASSGANPFERLQPSRSVKVLKPLSYNDAEAVSTSLKLGEAVVLCLAGTPDALTKRILDFSFGVASALDASVECVGAKVFAITRAGELSDAERSYLHSQGII